MERLIIKAKSLKTPKQVLHDKLLIISQGIIEDILPWSKAGSFSDKEFVADQEYQVFPGLMDIHCHGGLGVMPDSLANIIKLSEFYTRGGTTSVVLSVFFNSLEKFAQVVELIKIARNKVALNLLGLHLEGPFLNPDFCGSIPNKYIKEPDMKLARQIVEIGKSELRIITLAPELLQINKLVRYFKSQGIIVSLGHSQATAEQTKQSLLAGASLITHLGNAMRPFHQREVGIMGQALLEKDLAIELIVDGYHLSPEAVRVFEQAKSGDLIIVSDSSWAAGLPKGKYKHSSWGEVEVSSNAVRDKNGYLAGGFLPLLSGVRNMAEILGVSLAEVINLATSNPAKLLGQNKLVEIRRGNLANLILLNYQYKLEKVIIRDRVVR